jgi:hypothetical protein
LNIKALWKTIVTWRIMQNDDTIWRKLLKHNLVESDLSRLASPWHTDLDLGRPIEVMTDMSKVVN